MVMDFGGGVPAATEAGRRLAAGLTVNGRARLTPPRGLAPGLSRMDASAQRLKLPSGGTAPAMEWLRENARAAYQAARAHRPGGPRLPAKDGVARIRMLCEGLTRDLDAQVTPGALEAALIAFDKNQNLTMEEIFLAPEALLIALAQAFAQAGREVLADQKARLRAENWVLSGAPVKALRAEKAAFWEHALKLLHEEDMPEARCALEAYLAGKEGGAQAVIRRDHERQALFGLRLENAMTSIRALGGADWKARFARVSRCERCLREDSVYPHMDEESRAALRERVRVLSLASGLTELTVARAALRAALSAEEGAPQTACWWLCDDEGAQALMARLDAPGAAPRLTPDPTGRAFVFMTAALGLLFFALFLRFTGRALFALPLIFLCWQFATGVLGAVLTRALPVRTLLKMEFDRIEGDKRTLVTVPALLSSPERARALCAQLETLGCLIESHDVEFLLLGDFKDAPAARTPEDQAILDAAQSAVSRLNARAGWEKYHYLHRNRVFFEPDLRFMGRERKRGALEDLNRYLLTGVSAFDATGETALARDFRYVITLDADTCALPSAIKRMIGAMAHPLNQPRTVGGAARGYAILQPRVELTGGNRFARLMAGRGGLDSYPASVSDLYQDFCGRSAFGGKGIYDVRAFTEALDGKLPEGAILSHDLIEGILAGAGYLGDVTVHDAFPATLPAYLKRLDRWTRGDWQLLPLLFGKLKLDALGRFMALDNLARSLAPLSALFMLIVGLWTGNAAAFLTGLLQPALPLITSLFQKNEGEAGRFVTRLMLLPADAFTRVKAAATALHRVYRSRKNLLEWTTAADAEGGADARAQIPGKAAAIVLIPALFRPAFAIAALGTLTLFFIASDYVEALTRAPSRARLDSQSISALLDLARRTWRFFAETVPVGGHGLPPDNVQTDPPVGAANRTSPTNIGLYMVACVAARALGLIGREAMEERLGATTATLETLPKWKGHLYNWYGLPNLSPLPPRYVSAVDSGNLAACLLLCAAAAGGELGARMEDLARGMDFTALYDDTRRLFRIGMDVERDWAGDAHYDLLASEARILSYVALMLGQVPQAHWFALGRGRSGRALVSWSGTLFEYLMPELFMRAPEGSLLGESNRAVVAAQRKAGGDVWGVSESGFFAFDLDMNYQYRAFGLAPLALRGGDTGDVIAPYASALALSVDAQAAAQNLQKLMDAGFADETGLYEAVDASPERMPEGERYRVVYSHMAHHQGMILASLCNLLTGDSLVRHFSGRPEARALSLLLEEKGAPPAPRSLRPRRAEPRATLPGAAMARRARMGGAIPDAHLLYGGEATCLTGERAPILYQRRGVLANRFREGAFRGETDGIFVHVKADHSYLRPERAVFAPGGARYAADGEELTCRADVTISPEDGSFYESVTLQNAARQPRDVEVTGCFAVALCALSEQRAHPAFENLFVVSDCPKPGALVFHRRTRGGEPFDELTCALLAPGNAVFSFETDLEKLAGREGDLSRPETLPRTLKGTTGATLNPCACIRARFKLEPGDARTLVFFARLGRGAADLPAPASAERARLLAGARSRAMLNYLSLNAWTHNALQRASAFLFDPRLSPPTSKGARPQTLFSMGLSGQLPILAAFIASAEQVTLARELARAHEFYRAAGVESDLVFVNDYGNDYRQPVRDKLLELIASGHLRGLAGKNGGVRLLEGGALDDTQREALKKAAAVCVYGGRGDLTRQLNRLLSQGRAALDAPRYMRPDYAPPQEGLLAANGLGGFAPDGRAYILHTAPGKLPPAAWCTVLANPEFGTLVSDRGGGFTWHKNSRLCRLTSFACDPLREGFSEEITLTDVATGRVARVLPVVPPARVCYAQGAAIYESGAEGLSWRLSVFVDPEKPIKGLLLSVKNENAAPRRLSLRARVNFLMGADAADMRLTGVRETPGAIWAVGAMEGAGCLSLPGARAAAGALAADCPLAPGEETNFDIQIGWSDSTEAIPRVDGQASLSRARALWDERLTRIALHTPDPLINAMVTRFLPYQAYCARVYGRTGLYQSGGAFGFRDQLQDMLCLLPIDPSLVRAHILRAAARQFAAGDVLHWWHEPYTGVRTRISDDLLFLPYVTEIYVRETGDAAILEEVIPFLADEPIPEGREDLYKAFSPGEEAGTLKEHCLRAFGRASETGPGGLPRMGGGDWNDGMNRVGGESVWLAEFLSVAAAAFATLCEGDEKKELAALAQARRQAAVEAGWDGGWYRRAYFAYGTPLGSKYSVGGCRIDLIAQAWAALAGLPKAKEAMDAAWEQLADEDAGVIKLLTPPFDKDYKNPGYIAAYPPGIRENGGQYTHGACWAVMGWAKLGQAERAWRAFRMLMPYAHADTPKGARRYRVEPYAVAGDVYGEAPHAGRGGWTWYTGAASWLCRAAYVGLMGYEREGARVRLAPLLPPEWNEASVVLRAGASVYTLTGRRGAAQATLDGSPLADGWVVLADDGKAHTAVFPVRES